MKNKLKKYSVLLLRPDYVAGEFGHDTYYAFITASTITAAVTCAQQHACLADDEPMESTHDYYVLLVLEGHHKDLSRAGGL